MIAYEIPSFISFLDWCEITYSYETSLPQQNSLMSVLTDPSLTFTFEDAEDISLSGSNEKSYTITVTGVTGSTPILSASASFSLTVKNPCIDSDKSSIEQKPLPEGIVYTLMSSPNENGFSFVHGSFNFVIDA